MYEVRIDEATTNTSNCLNFSAELKEPYITNTHTAEIKTNFRCGGSESIIVGVSAELPLPWVSDEGSPQIILIPPKTYPEMARTLNRCWLPERDTISRLLNIKSTKIEPESSIEITYEVWALPNDENLGIQTGKYYFTRDYGEFIMEIYK